MKINYELINKLKEKVINNEFDSLPTPKDVFLESIENLENILNDISTLQYKKEGKELIDELMIAKKEFEKFTDIINLIDTAIRSIEEVIPILMDDENLQKIRRIIELEQHPPQCTKCTNKMVIREGPGEYFWGCSSFPDCWGKRFLTNEERNWIYDGVKPQDKTDVIVDKEEKEFDDINLLENLSNGYDPYAGEVLEKDHICQNVQISNILKEAFKALKKERNNNKKKKNAPKNAGKKWTSEEDEKLLAMFNDKYTIKEIAEYFERTSGSIRSRLLDFGHMTSN